MLWYENDATNDDFICLLLHNNTDEYSCPEVSLPCPDLCMFAARSACMTNVLRVF